ncbi:hypothetical protein AOLI_G00094970 [Acnodon oligacanthus]
MEVEMQNEREVESRKGDDDARKGTRGGHVQLHGAEEPEEEPRAFTPSTAYPTTDPTVEEQGITAGPEEPGPQPQTFSEPQKDTQISKLTTEGKNEAEKATHSQVDDLKESLLRLYPKGTTIQRKMDFTLYDDVRDPGEVYEALQAEKRTQEL